MCMPSVNNVVWWICIFFCPVYIPCVSSEEPLPCVLGQIHTWHMLCLCVVCVCVCDLGERARREIRADRACVCRFEQRGWECVMCVSDLYKVLFMDGIMNEFIEIWSTKCVPYLISKYAVSPNRWSLIWGIGLGLIISWNLIWDLDIFFNNAHTRQ